MSIFENLQSAVSTALHGRNYLLIKIIDTHENFSPKLWKFFNQVSANRYGQQR